MDFKIIKTFFLVLILNLRCFPFQGVKIGLINLDYSLSDSTRVIRFLLCCTFLRWRQHLRVWCLLKYIHQMIIPLVYIY